MELSIVVTTRNDDHGGQMLERMRLFLAATAEYSSRYNVGTELVVVEWNPPANKPLQDALSWPLKTRIITVPSRTHNALEHSDKFPIFQMIAKNVGISRAGGEFILATNPDVVMVPEIFQRIAAGLDIKYMYRVPRVDVHTTDLPPGPDVDQWIAWFCNRPRTSHRALWRYGGLSTMACGDFTLLHRGAWFEMRGYPVAQKWSPHIDTLFVSQAAICGYEQVFWDDLAVFHIDHKKSLSTEPDYATTYPTVPLALVEDLYVKGNAFVETAKDLGVGISPYIGYNSWDWGYPGEVFEEWEN